MKLLDFFKRKQKEVELTKIVIALQKQYADASQTIKKLELEIERYERSNNERLVKLESRVRNFTA